MELSTGKVCITDFLVETIKRGKDWKGAKSSKYDSHFESYSLFPNDEIRRFSISYRFKPKSADVHKMIFSRFEGTTEFNPISVMVNFNA
jgi:hypothetical protein